MSPDLRYHSIEFESFIYPEVIENELIFLLTYDTPSTYEWSNQ